MGSTSLCQISANFSSLDRLNRFRRGYFRLSLPRILQSGPRLDEGVREDACNTYVSIYMVVTPLLPFKLNKYSIIKTSLYSFILG